MKSGAWQGAILKGIFNDLTLCSAQRAVCPLSLLLLASTLYCMNYEKKEYHNYVGLLV